MKPKQIAELAHIPVWKVYYIAKKLQRLPTVEEATSYHGDVGRPPKNYKREDTKKW